jgi:hypothetical protein
MSHYEQFTAMLDNARQVSPMVFKRKSINLTSESTYKVVEMESPAGRILFGFSKDTGDLVDVIGPCRFTPEAPTPVLNDKSVALGDVCIRAAVVLVERTP